QIEGVSPEYFEIRSWGVSAGDVFSAADVQAATKVAILGQTVADKLFGDGGNVVDGTVRIGNLPFRVVGIAESKGQSASGTDYDDVVFVPAPTCAAPSQGRLQEHSAGNSDVAARSADEIDDATDAIRRLLREQHRLKTDTE